MTSIHPKCPAWTQRDGHILLCDKSPEHINSEVPSRRVHFDAGADVRWTDAVEPVPNEENTDA